MTSQSRKILSVTALIVVIAATGAILFFVFDRVRNPNTQSGIDTGAAIVDSDSYYDGSTAVEPARAMPDFTLTANNGEPISLSDLRGKITLMYFGYTHCPDFCPTTLADFKRVKAELGADAEQVAFVLVSVDGSRDTPAVMSEYLNQFDSSFVGMTGEEDAVEQIGADYGLHVEKLPGANAEEYMVDHAANVYMIDKEGRLTTIFMYATEVEVLVEHVQAALAA